MPAQPSLERVKELYEYDPLTGIFRHRVARGCVRIGDIAGWMGKYDYWIINVDGKKFPATNIAWLYMTGTWPTGIVDHRNGNQLDNSWKNLRDATRAQNVWNSKKRSSNKSGFKGVSLCTTTGRWRATIVLNGKQHSLGRHSSAELAHEAYKQAAAKLFGEYARFE